MASTTPETTESYAERLVEAVRGGFELYAVFLGDRLGLYRAIADADDGLTPGELAAAAGVHERYAREWCEHGAVTGLLRVADPDAPPGERRYVLPDAAVPVLVDEDDPEFLGGLPQTFVGSVSPVDAILEAYRTGGGVPYEAYGRHMHEGQARMNRPAFLHSLGEEWLPALPDVDARLREPGARVADVGCGHAWSAVGIARAYPEVEVDGYDLDAASVAAAREHVREAGLDDRVTVHHADAADVDGDYDLVTAFECLHDLSDPVGVLAAMRRLAAPGGTVLVMDERVGERFGEEAPFEWLMYGWSIVHCLPVGMADEPSAATGTVMRPDTLREYAREAGFSAVEVLPFGTEFFRFYRLTV